MTYANWLEDFPKCLTACLKLLLETKHLYQNATVDVGIWDKLEHANHWPLEAATTEWAVHDNSVLLSAVAPAVSPKTSYCLYVPDVKLLCQTCDRIEAFNSISSQEFTQHGKHLRKTSATTETIQVFVLSFLCQSCKRVPEIFLVRRHGFKLTLCGRAPIEVADVPPEIPKTARQYYSGALVAHQSGQTLAGLFLLRTLIEQWARSQVPEPAPSRADELLDAYMATLPLDFKSRFPSMRSLYDDISADLHSATGSADLFDKALSEIKEHFDARRLFKLKAQ